VRLLSATLLALVALLGLSTPALATNDVFLGSYTLLAGHSYASTSAHSGVNWVQTSSDHTACPSLDQGHTGDFTAAPDITGTCGTGTVRWSPGSLSGFWHGTAYNPNASTTDNITDARYDY
jgi:hypothetical protein